ncbi:MAG TPA: alpha/beta fold hydrolase [Dehalococcoidia bacterium]|nr:alpha/beta fold hydrolase [Dehalococcoidia bacterium]
MDQNIRFCTAPDGVRIAYTTAGSGTPLVLCPGWISHLELDWMAPFFRAFWEPLAEKYHLVRYDRRGTGLSDRNVEDYSLEAQTGDLTAVVEAIGARRIVLFGHCTGGPIAILYTASHPEMVSHLIFYGTYASGNYVRVSELADALLRLIDADWGGAGSLAMADMFFPGASSEERQTYAAYQRMCATKETARAQALTVTTFNAKQLVKEIQTPALVFHKRDDKIVPFELGRQLAGNLPNGRFVPLEGDSNVIGVGSAQVTRQTIDAVLDFLAETPMAPAANGGISPSGITSREKDVLRLIAAGKSNRQIAEELSISVNTADRHVSNILTKIAASNRAEAASYAVRAGIAS